VHTSSGEGFAVERLVMHRRIIGKDVTIRVVAVPAATMRAEEIVRLRGRRRDGGLAEKAESAMMSEEESTHNGDSERASVECGHVTRTNTLRFTW